MKPSSSLKSTQPFMDLDNESWQALRFERKKRRLLRKVMAVGQEIQLEQVKSKAQQSARRDWMLFGMTCILMATCVAWIVFKAWLELRFLDV
jgi:cytoskeletal protein RodZ